MTSHITMTNSPTADAPRTAGRPADRPLSFAQQRMWFMEELVPGTSLQNIPLAVRLTGPLDIDAVRGAFRAVVRRHDTLRTAFGVHRGAPGHTVLAPEDAEPELSLVDLCGTAGAEGRALGGWLHEQATEPFDLGRPPLLRIGLARLGPEEHVLSLTVHHLVCDGWSLDVLIREFNSAYTELAGGAAEPSLAEPAVRYAEFAERQHRRFTDGSMSADLAYWRERLAGDPTALELPTDRPRPEEPGYRGARIRREIPQPLLDAVAAAARGRGVTPYMVLLAAYSALLHRCAGQAEVIVGTPIAGRSDVDTEELIGLFANTLPLRVDLSGDPSFGDLLRRVRTTAIGAYAHQGLPFEKIVEELRPDRGSHLTPLFRTMFILQNATTTGLELPGLSAEAVETHNGTSRFDLQLIVGKRSDGWVATLEYDTDLFDRGTAERMLDRYLTLLEGAVAEPGTRLSRLPLLSATERRRVLEIGRKARDFPVTECLHETFARHARRRPDAVAVSCEGRSLTYAELDGRAEALAVRLRAAGVGRESLVGLFLDRGLDTAVAILGVFKAGGGYVPMDPLYPAARLARILGDATPHVLITHDALRGALPDYDGHLLVIDRPEEPFPDPARPVPARDGAPLAPNNAAYVIYTSGSTGTPKGVQVSHATVARMFAAMTATSSFDFGEDDAWPMLHSYAFDVSVVEMWGAWLHGGRLVVVPAETARDPEAYYALVREEGITVLNQTPSAFVHFAAVDARHDPAELPLRTIIFGGEALESGTLASWFQRHGDRGPRLVNMYGITETIHVTIREMTAEDVRQNRRSPIGRPMPDMELYALDELLQPVPIGVTGELYVGGPGLARCYFRDPHKTADRFVPHPFSPVPGARLYKSGDLARLTPRGEFEYVGRADHQVKIRGYRIETGEVEAVLLDHPDVHAAVIVPQRAADGEMRLYGYATLEPGAREGEASGTTAALLRDHLAERLPAYMVPTAVVVLAALPLTVNGKVDRKALPVPEPVRAESTTAYVAPRTSTEQRVAQAWRELLGLERVGVHDSFFDLGGYSLLATRLVFRLREEFATGLPLRTLFSDPTVAGIAAVLDGSGAADQDRGAALAPVAAMRADTVLGEGITGFPAPARPGGEHDVLLTGATGFLGAFLLDALLEATGATVHCLVRAEDEAGAQRRLEKALSDFGLWDPTRSHRIRAVAGDLAAPRLGLAPAAYEDLAARVDAIYHSGAAVNLVLPYEELRPATVDGTREILRLATATGRAAVHHVSTVGVFAGPPADGKALAETSPTGPPELLRQGYTQSKWVAEQVIELARAEGVPVTLHRPARISGHTVTGACQTDDFLWRVIKGCVQAGAVPRGLTAEADLVPVDYVARAIVAVAARPEALGGLHHQVNTRPVPLSRVLGHVRDFGYRLDELEPSAWVDLVKADPANAAYPLLSLFDPAGGGFTSVRFSDEDTRAHLAGTGITCPPLDARLFHTYLGYFVGSGYLPAPR
ncbi:non-ribosomal peptide synthetase [Streptomyces sp. A1136]|uniref:non-ribosomal peptide synthetase n=1 Tax=Streptomyces sp. A1136 TaxID=2563102 RepID=UPI00109E58AB|nr:non-ribosomal peptide synthetase [Streptomyces sp. A1136]THA54595.1 amino acid adenylation domain-containing protein [Streptomyces sp. A1136]